MLGIASILMAATVFSGSAETLHHETDPTVRFRTLDRNGKSRGHVKIFRVQHVLEGLWVDLITETNSRGVAPSDSGIEDSVGIAPDGSVAIGHNSDKLIFARPGYLTLQLVDDHHLPLKGIRTTLVPARDRSSLKSFGDLQLVGELPAPYRASLTRVTDAEGFARFKKLPLGGRFGVIVHAGPDGDDLEFDGAVEVGKKTQVIVANDCEVSGHVYRGSGQTPIVGAEVQIYLDDFSGQGLQQHLWKSTKTDAQGAYSLTGLPNCSLPLTIKTGDTNGIVMSSVDGGDWIDRGSIGNGPGCFLDYGSADVRGQVKNTVDFRLDVAALVQVHVRNPRDENVAGCSIGLAQLLNGRLPEQRI